MWTFCLELLVTDLKSSSILSIYPFKFSSSSFLWFRLCTRDGAEVLVYFIPQLYSCENMCGIMYTMSLFVTSIGRLTMFETLIIAKLWILILLLKYEIRSFRGCFYYLMDFSGLKQALVISPTFLRKISYFLVVKFTCVTHM